MKQFSLLLCILFSVNLFSAEISEDDLNKIKEFHTTVNIVAKSFEEVDLPNLPSKLKDIRSQIDSVSKSSMESDKNLSESIEAINLKIDSIEKNLNQTVDLLNKLSKKFLELEFNTKNNSSEINSVKQNLSTDNELHELKQSMNSTEAKIVSTQAVYEKLGQDKKQSFLSSNKYYANTNPLKIKQAPSMNSKVIMEVPFNTELNIGKCNEYGWCESITPSKGYVAKYLIRRDK